MILPTSLFGAVVFALTLGFSDSRTTTESPLPTASLPSAAPGYGIGDKAADFSLRGVDGAMHSLSDLPDAKGYVVVFTCNTCPMSKAYEDRIIALHKEFAPQGYPVIAINPNDPTVQPGDSFEAMQARAKEKSLPYLYLFDEGQRVYPAFGATRTPHVFFLDSDRVLVYTGAIDDSRDVEAVGTTFLADAIRAHAAGKAINPATTKAIGCGIKAKA